MNSKTYLKYLFKTAATRSEVKKQTPSEAQIQAGNYPKLHLTWQGLDISIENPRGSTRSGVDPDGNEWSHTMSSDYGYIRRTQARDGDHVDCFLSPSYRSATVVHIIDQVDPKSKKFDEHKCMIGWGTQDEARKAYLENYDRGWSGLGAITTVGVQEFKTWVRSPSALRPYSRTL